MKNYITIDIGGTAIKHGVINENEEFVTTSTIDSHAYKGGLHLVELVKNIITQYIKEYDISAVSISTAGMVDIKKGEIIYSGKQIPNYIGTNWKKIIKDNFKLECEIDNDVNCAGLAEATSGAGKNKQAVVCLTIGTGIGACFVQNGYVYHGHSYSGFEVGYMKLQKGDFQDIASTTALIEIFKQKKPDFKKALNGKVIFELAKNGDEIAISAIDELIDNMCLGIANICYTVNPDIVILGGGIMEQKEYMLPKIEKNLQQYLIKNIYDNTKIDTAYHKNSAGMLGAYYHLKNMQHNL